MTLTLQIKLPNESGTDDVTIIAHLKKLALKSLCPVIKSALSVEYLIYDSAQLPQDNAENRPNTRPVLLLRPFNDDWHSFCILEKHFSAQI